MPENVEHGCWTLPGGWVATQWHVLIGREAPPLPNERARGGNYLEWVCAWWFLSVLQDYQDRDKGKNWTHIYNDVAVLKSRHAFAGNQTDVALALFEVYFGDRHCATLKDENCLWNHKGCTGILGRTNYKDTAAECQALNDWIINLALVGFHLHDGEDAKSLVAPQSVSLG